METKPPKMIDNLSGLIESLVWRIFKEKRELDRALEQYQSDYVEMALRGMCVADSLIPGIGALVKNRLADHGITNAQDVDSNRLISIHGLGVSTVRDLLAWRYAEEQVLRATMPRQLPPEEAAKIKARKHPIKQGAGALSNEPVNC